MSIMNKFRRVRNKLTSCYNHWKSGYYFWLLRPKIYAVPLLAIVAFILSSASVLETGENIILPNARALESVAMAVEQTPDLWQKTLDEKKSKGQISDYQYQIEVQQMRDFARQAPELAAKIRSDKLWKVIGQSGAQATMQTVQMVGGKATGRATRYIATRVEGAGIEIIEKGYRTAGRHVYNAGIKFFWEGGNIAEMSDNMFNISWELTALSQERNQMTPELEKAMKSPGFAELINTIQAATQQNPDKLMQAALFHEINMIMQKNDPNSYTDEEYRDLVMRYAGSLNKLTRAGGSPDSVWKDANDLARWLAANARRPLPAGPEETDVSPVEPSPSPEEPLPTGLSFAFAKYAIGSFLPPLPKELQGCQSNVIDFTFALTPYSEESYQVEEGLVGGTGRLILKKIGIEQMVDFRFEKSRYLPDTGTMEGEVIVTRTMKDASGEKKFTPGTIHWHGKKTGNPRFFEVGDIIEGVFDQAFDIFPKGFSFSLTIG